jgi:hypothetical protein
VRGGALSFVVYLLGWFEVPPFGLLPGVGYVGALVIALVAISIVRRKRTHMQAIENDLDRTVLQEQ